MNDPDIEKAVNLLKQLAKQLIVVDAKINPKKTMGEKAVSKQIDVPDMPTIKYTADEVRAQLVKTFEATGNLKHSIKGLVSITGFKYSQIANILKGEQFKNVERGVYKLNVPDPAPYIPQGDKTLTPLTNSVELLKVMMSVITEPMRPGEVRMAITAGGYNIATSTDPHMLVCHLLDSHAKFRRIGKGYYECVG